MNKKVTTTALEFSNNSKLYGGMTMLFLSRQIYRLYVVYVLETGTLHNTVKLLC